jgi:long-chain acyl-CoA synthetase
VFFQQLAQKGSALAAIENEQLVSYAELAVQCDDFAQQLGSKRQLIFLKAANNIATLVAYLAALRSKHPILLLEPELSDGKLAKLIKLFNPNLLIENKQIQQLHHQELDLAPQLSLLLSTSGSTGSAKQVALSSENLQANAHSICAYLPMKVSDKAITTLPFFYSYGLSVINSHLQAGGCIVFNQHSLVSREFWQTFKQHEITSFAGVPYSYEMLLKLRFTRMELPSLRYFTQAGGRLTGEKVEELARYASEQGKAFFVMYGQTEATARMAYLSAEKVLAKPNTIGQAIPGGRLSLLDEQGQPISAYGGQGELCYSGDNVMLGYAQCAQDLAAFSAIELLHTGDLAYCDEQGDFTICGRLKRFIKLFGQRINLDEVENLIQDNWQLENYCCGDDKKLLIGVKNCEDIQSLKTFVCSYLNLHHSVVEVCSVSDLPLTSNGKKDYQGLMKSCFSGVSNV